MTERHDATSRLRKTAPLVLVAALLALPAAFASAPPAAVDEGADLLELAAAFGAQPRSTASADTRASCGESGHCNVVNCPDPNCAAGEVPEYKCAATSLKCSDKHDQLNPFDNDEHFVYDCTSTCLRKPPTTTPQECIIGNPLGGCLVYKPEADPCFTSVTASKTLDAGKPELPPGSGAC